MIVLAVQVSIEGLHQSNSKEIVRKTEKDFSLTCFSLLILKEMHFVDTLAFIENGLDSIPMSCDIRKGKQ